MLGQRSPGSVPEVFAPGIVSLRCNFEYAPTFSPDGRELWFTRGNSLMVSRLTDDGDLYVTRLGPDWRGEVVTASPTADGYSDTIPVPGINSDQGRGSAHPFVSWDGRMLIFGSFRPGARGGDWDADFFISFRSGDGRWSPPVRLDQTLDSPGQNICPSLSPDGRYFIFTAHDDIYWLSAEVLQRYRPPGGATPR